LYGIIGFMLGGLLVSMVAVTIEKPEQHAANSMTRTLEYKHNKDFDQAFMDDMIEHHQGAIDMAKLAKERTARQQLKDFSEAIIATQQKELDTLKQWQHDWGLKP
jgi:uncharacterized protein (DUF305 family)